MTRAAASVSARSAEGSPDAVERAVNPAASDNFAVPVLSLRDVSFGYGSGLQVVDSLSLSIEAGTIVGIVGPSGCGKSTVLSLVSGLLQPSEGTVERHFESSDRHPLSMVFQGDTLLPWLTAADNIRLFSRFRKHGQKLGLGRHLFGFRTGPSKYDLDERVRSLLNLAQLSDYADAYPYQLSGGMRRRLAFLTAVAPNPEFLLLDEPFSAVDEPTRIGIHQDVFRIAKMMKMTSILVTHDLAEAITLCDRVLILSRRPARIVHDHSIPFGATREMLEIRECAEFLELYGQLWHNLSIQITGRGEAAKTLPNAKAGP